MATKLDRIDRKILNLLQEDYTMSVSDISAQLLYLQLPAGEEYKEWKKKE